MENIECHHSIPISQMDDNQKTKIQDIIMVCSNCHRMLHRKKIIYIS
jgi:putative restriction endonuclease